MGVQQTLRRALPDLSKKLALAARYALEHPDRMALHSMRRTAGEVGVTSTTMLRLARRAGFDSYDDFRAGFQSELLQGAFGARADALHGTGAAAPQAVPPQAGAPGLADKILHSAETSIRRSRATLRQTDLDQVAALLRSAPNVYLVASSALFWLAAIMKHTGTLILDNLRLVGAEHSVAAEAMAALRPGDVVIGFGVDPIAQRTIDALHFARSHGAHVVAITDHPGSLLGRDAAITLCAETGSPHYYPSLVAVLAVVEALLATVVAHGDGTELQRIQQFEAIRRSSGRYAEG